MGNDKRNASVDMITPADIEELCNRVEREAAHTGSSPDRVIMQVAEEYLRPDLGRQRKEQEDRHEDEMGRVDREHLPAVLRGQAREHERLEHHLSLQVRELAAAIEDIYWSRRRQDGPDAVQNIPEATRQLQDKHRAEEVVLAQLHDRDLEWLHGEPNVRFMLAWISRLSPRAVDAALSPLRQLHDRELEVLKARHEHDIRVKSLVLEHEQERAVVRAVAGQPPRYSEPEKGGRSEERPRRPRKPDMDFER